MKIIIWINDSIRIANILIRINNCLTNTNNEVRFISNLEKTSKFYRGKGIDCFSLENLIYEKNLKLIKLNYPKFDYLPAIGDSLLTIFEYKKNTLPKQISNKFNDVSSQISIFFNIWEKLINKKIDHILILNGMSVQAYTLAKIAEKKSVSFSFWENGILPNSIFIDPVGVNACSSFANEENLTPTNKNLILNNFPNININELFNKLINDEILKIENILITLQVDHDSNIKCFSYFYSTNDFVNFLFENIIKKMPDKKFIFRVHPRDKKSIYFCLFLSSRNKNIAVSTNRNFEEDLNISDFVITINSTTGIEALLKNKPTLAFGKSCYSGYMNKYFYFYDNLKFDVFFLNPIGETYDNIRSFSKKLKNSSLFFSETDEVLNKKIKELIKKSSIKSPFFENENSINAFINKKFSYDIPNTKNYLRYYIYKIKRLITKLRHD